ncbi:hypothetical protein Tco_0698329 [Tanacetum coccineum]
MTYQSFIAMSPVRVIIDRILFQGSLFILLRSSSGSVSGTLDGEVSNRSRLQQVGTLGTGQMLGEGGAFEKQLHICIQILWHHGWSIDS